MTVVQIGKVHRGMTPMTNVKRLTAIEAIRNLKAGYCRLEDARNWTQFPELFSPTQR
jgi:hypothetical protein